MLTARVGKGRSLRVKVVSMHSAKLTCLQCMLLWASMASHNLSTRFSYVETLSECLAFNLSRPFWISDWEGLESEWGIRSRPNCMAFSVMSNSMEKVSKYLWIVSIDRLKSAATLGFSLCLDWTIAGHAWKIIRKQNWIRFKKKLGKKLKKNLGKKKMKIRVT